MHQQILGQPRRQIYLKNQRPNTQGNISPAFAFSLTTNNIHTPPLKNTHIIYEHVSSASSQDAVLCFQADPLHSRNMWLNEWLYLYTVCFWISTQVVYLQHCFGHYMAGAPWNCCCLGTCSVYTLQPCTSLQCYFIQSHKYFGRMCKLVVTYHLHFWQGNQDLLHATAVL